MIRWDGDADRQLLLAIIKGAGVIMNEATCEKVAEVYQGDEKPTGKAIQERLSRMRSQFKKYGTAEPRRKQKDEEDPHGQTETAPKARKPRAPKVSKDKVTKPKASKCKRGKSRVNSEDTSDDGDYAPVKGKCSREAKALAKENPDFSRYGKEASPSRKRAKKDVVYSEEEAIKSEPHSEERNVAIEAMRDDSGLHPSPEAIRLSPIDTMSANLYGHQGLSQQSSFAYLPTPTSSYPGSNHYSFGGPAQTPVTPSYSIHGMPDLTPMGMQKLTSSFYPTPNSSFSSDNSTTYPYTGYHSERRDSVIDGGDFGIFNGIGNEHQSQSSEATNLGFTRHGLDGSDSSTDHPRTNFVTPSPKKMLSENSQSQLGGLKRATTFNGTSAFGMPITPITPHHILGTQIPTPNTSLADLSEANKPGLGIHLARPPLQRSMTDSNFDIMISGHHDNGQIDHFATADFAGLGGTFAADDFDFEDNDIF